MPDFKWEKVDDHEDAYVTPSGRVLMSVLVDTDGTTDDPLSTYAVLSGSTTSKDGGPTYERIARFTSKEKAMAFVEFQFA